MTRALALTVLLLSVSSCDKLLKSAAKAARNTDEAAELGRAGRHADEADDFGRAGRNADELAEQGRINRYMSYVETAQKAFQVAEELGKTNPAEGQAAMEKILANDAGRDLRLPEAFRAWIYVAIGLSQYHRQLAFKAEQSFRAALEETSDPSDPDNLAPRQYAQYLLGNFGDAFALATARTQAEEGGTDAEDATDRAELAALAELPDSGELIEKAIVAIGKDDVAAVLLAYAAILEAKDGRMAEADARLGRALESAALAKTCEWSFATLGKPFAGDEPWRKCATAYYEPLRTRKQHDESLEPVVAGIKTLRTCLKQLPAPKKK